eukprot:3730267-Heterocapsa_arctica.AAC.1
MPLTQSSCFLHFSASSSRRATVVSSGPPVGPWGTEPPSCCSSRWPWCVPVSVSWVPIWGDPAGSRASSAPPP